MAFVPRQRATTKPKDTRTLYFGDIRGVDFRSEETTSYRTPESVNMYRSRRGYWETHVGFRSVGDFGSRVPIWGIHKFHYTDRRRKQKEKVLVHIGSRMFVWDNYPEPFEKKDLTELFNGIAQRRTKYIEFDEELIILDGEHLFYFDGDVFDYVEHKARVPQIYLGKTPSASESDESNERRNFLTPWVIEGFAPDGTTEYVLSAVNIDGDPVYVWYFDDGAQVFLVEGTDFEVDRELGVVSFESPPAAEIEGVENVYIKYSNKINGYADRINKCTDFLVCDKRIFLTGNPMFPNCIFWSGDSDWTFWDELNYSDKAGTSSAQTLALQRLQENRFLSIKEDTDQDGAYTVWEQMDLDFGPDATLYETYISHTGVSTKGVVSSYAHKVFLDDNVFLSTNGLNAISRNLSVSNERNIEHRSTLVDAKLLAEDLKSAIVEEHRDHLYILFPNGHCYMANSKLKTDEVSVNTEYEWAYLEGVASLEGTTLHAPTQLKSFNDNELYMCSSNGHLYKFYFDKEASDGTFPNSTYNFDGRPINDYVDTPFSWFGIQNRYKKLVKKYNDLYCEVKTKANIEVLYHTEKSSIADSRILPFRADVFGFNEINFENVKEEEWDTDFHRPIDGWVNPKNFTFNALPPASFVMRKLKGKRFRRLQIRVKSADINRPLVFKSLVVEAEILTRRLK